MSPWERLLERPLARGHFVQLYQTGDLSLARNVNRYVWEGLKRGEGVLLIATPVHAEIFRRELSLLGADVESCVDQRRLVFLDAQEALSQFMVDGQPDWYRFESVVGAALRHVRSDGPGLRAYGEMVGLLWNSRQFAAAVRLEQFWNKLLTQSSFSLYCAYAVDIFGKEFHVGALNGVLCTHSHLIPAAPDGNLDRAVDTAMDELLGARADHLRILIKANYRPSWGVMPRAESSILWLRNNLPHQAESIVARAQQYYREFTKPASSPMRAES